MIDRAHLATLRLALAAAVAWPAAAHAAAPAAADTAATEPEGLGEIIVTANKRAEDVQNVAVPVTALNEAMIEQKFSRDLLDLGSIAPNLIVDPILGGGTAAVSIRGIQLNDVEKSFDPPVGVFLDGVYLASTTGALLTVFDASTIEVLRGPQGTLFGRNTIGGLINITRNKPTGEFGGKASVTYGSYDQLDAKGVINLPAFAGGAVKAKLAAVRLSGGGYFYNVTRHVREGYNDLLMLSPQVSIEPAPGIGLDLTYDYIRDDTPTRPVTALTQANQLFGTLPGGIGLGEPADDVDYHRHPTTSLEQRARQTTHSVTANGHVTLSPGNEIVAVLNYRTTDEDAIQEFDGVAAELFHTQRPQQIDQFSAELRYQGDIGRAKIVAGGYYFDSSYNLNQRTYFFGGEVGGTDYQQHARSYAGFAQLDWEVVDNLTLTLGGRYLEDRKEACGGLGQGPVDARSYLVSYGDCNAVRQAAPGYSNVIPGTGGALATGRAKWDKFTPKAGISYKLDHVLVYGTYSEGFRSGGFNGRGSSVLTLGPYNPEKVKNVELGLKSDWFDRRLQVNLSAFHAKYQNKQEDVVFPDPAGATVTIVQNAASATLQGAEAEIKAVAARGLTLGLNVGYLDAKYDKYLDLGTILDGPTAGQLGTIDKSAFKLRRAPRWTLDANATYDVPLSAHSSLILNADYNYKSSYYIVANTVTIDTPNPGLVRAFGDLNASVSYKLANFKLSVFGRNLTDESHFLHALDVGTTFGRTAASPAPIPTFGLFSFGTINAPRTFGVELGVSF